MTRIEDIKRRWEDKSVDVTWLVERVEGLELVLGKIKEIIDESHGVIGWHLNGDIAEWGEFDFNIEEALAEVEVELKSPLQGMELGKPTFDDMCEKEAT